MMLLRQPPGSESTCHRWIPAGASAAAACVCYQSVQTVLPPAPLLLLTHPLSPPPLPQTNVPGATRIRVERSALTLDNGKLTFETVDLNTYQLYSVRLTAVGYGSVFSTWSSSALAGECMHLGAVQQY